MVGLECSCTYFASFDRGYTWEQVFFFLALECLAPSILSLIGKVGMKPSAKSKNSVKFWGVSIVRTLSSVLASNGLNS